MQVSCQRKVHVSLSINVSTESRYPCFDAFSVRQTQTNGCANICGQASKTERFCFIFHFHCQGHILSHLNPKRFKSSIIIGCFLLLIHPLYSGMCCALFWVCPQGSLVFVGISIQLILQWTAERSHSIAKVKPRVFITRQTSVCSGVTSRFCFCIQI